MEHIKSEETIIRQNSENCTATEYEFPNERDINSAVIDLKGRYPETGKAMNGVCKELIYVIEGAGTVTNGEEASHVTQGDMVLMQPGDQYFLDGELKLLISASPAWYPEQYRNV